MNKTLYLSNPVGYSSILSPFLKNLHDKLESNVNHKYSEPRFSEDSLFFYVDVDMPGVEEENVSISLDKGVLTIEGSSTVSNQSERKYYTSCDRSYHYSFLLPDTVNLTLDPKAVLQKGVLQLTFKKNEKEQPRKIAISKE